MKINLGAGKMRPAGFINVDIQEHPKAPSPLDIVADVRAVPLGDGCADEVHAYHLVEHFYRWEASALVREWARLLRPGGRLVLELPNLELAARNLLAGQPDQMCMWAFYGDPGHQDPYMCHRWGYTPKTIKALLAECGLHEIVMKAPQTHGGKVNRDMRVEAIKR